MSVPTAASISVENVTISYGPIIAVDSVSFELPRGGLALVLGSNGAGKTSLVSAVSGLVRCRAGRVVVDDRDVTRLPAFKRVGAGIALVPEGRGTLPGLSVRDNLFLGWRAAGPRQVTAALDDAVSEAVELFPRLGERLDQDCQTLSGGEMQMLAITRAILSRPSVLLLDEPSLGLAPQAVARVYEALGRLSKSGLTMVIVEQKAVPFSVIPTLTMVLQRGKVVYSKGGVRPTDDELASLYLGGETMPS